MERKADRNEETMLTGQRADEIKRKRKRVREYGSEEE